MNNDETKSAVIIQSWFRGVLFRLKRLPLILYIIQGFLKRQLSFQFSCQNADGRINSCCDEDKIITLLVERFKDRIKTQKIRMWYDILVLDKYYGWLPVNIKTTTTKTSDNTGNLAMCVYAYTNDKTIQINDHGEKSLENGKMSVLLFDLVKNKQWNKIPKKDYYFLVLNKTDKTDVIVNSVKGLSVLTHNINNLPFQVCWNKNRVFEYGPIEQKIKMLLDCFQKPKPSWKEVFLSNMRTIS